MLLLQGNSNDKLEWPNKTIEWLNEIIVANAVTMQPLPGIYKFVFSTTYTRLLQPEKQHQALPGAEQADVMLMLTPV